MISFPEAVIMATNDFLELPNYIANRDVEQRVAKLEHLTKVPVGEALVVSITELNGQLEKIDGHGRSLAWTQNPEIKPEQVMVMVYHITCDDDKQELYHQFCSRESSETNAEQLNHYMKLNGFIATSALGKGTWTTAFTRLGCESAQEGVDTYLESMKWLDTLGVETGLQKYWNTGIKVAFLDCLESDAEETKLFIQSYHSKNRDIQEVNELLNAVETKLGGKKGTDFEQQVTKRARKLVRDFRNRIRQQSN